MIGTRWMGLAGAPAAMLAGGGVVTARAVPVMASDPVPTHCTGWPRIARRDSCAQ